MRHIFRLLLLLVVLCAGVWALLFSLANNLPVALDLVFVVLPDASLSIWVLGAFVLGGLCGLAAASTAIWRMRLAMMSLRRQQKNTGAVPAKATPR